MKIKSSGRIVIVERSGTVFYVRHRNTVVSHVSGPYKIDDKRFTKV